MQNASGLSIVLRAVLAGLAAVVSSATFADTTQRPVVISNGQVFAATGEDPIPDGVVVIEGGLITHVGAAASVTVPEDARHIDAGGGTVMPGLIDARASTLMNKLKLADGKINSVGVKFLLEPTIKAGVTTVRATGWDIDNLPDLAPFRKALADLGNTAPRIVVAGLVAHADSSVANIYPNDAIQVSSKEDVVAATRAILNAGADQVGFLQGIPSLGRAPQGPDDRVGLSREQQEILVRLAKEANVKAVAQTAFPEDAVVAAEVGVQEILSWPGDPGEPLADDLLKLLADRGIPVLTGFSTSVIAPHPGDMRRFIDAGGTVVFGTFSPNSRPIYPYVEMRLMRDLGEMTPLEILAATTANAAQALGLADEIGTLEPGKRADVIVVAGDPLSELGAIRNVSVVIRSGEIVFRARP